MGPMRADVPPVKDRTALNGVDGLHADLTLDDLKECEISFAKTGAALHEWRTALGELTDSFGDEVDQNGVIFDD